MSIIQFDSWLASEGPVGVSIVEPLEPASGEGTVFFPPTYADPGGDKKKPYYAIDEISGGRICVIDSVASQANRMEPIFKNPELAELIPRFTVQAGERLLDILDLGHRAADAIVRFSDQGEKLREAFLEYRDQGSAEPLAKIAPTSLIFGAWDSRGDGQDVRGTQAKIPRLVESTIRAYGVERTSNSHGGLSRPAVYVTALTKEDLEKLGLEGTSEEGLANALAQGPGGIIAKDIKREALLNLIALRALGVPNDSERTFKLQRYVLGLALVSFVVASELYLRQGCLLVSSSSKPANKYVIWRNGKRELFTLTEKEAIAFAKAAAKDFGVGPAIKATFEPSRVTARTQRKAKERESAAGAGQR